MPSPPHYPTGNWGFDAIYPGVPPDGLELTLVDDNEYYDPETKLFFTTADVDGDEIRIYSKRSMAEIDDKYGKIISRDRYRVVIGKRTLTRETPPGFDPQELAERKLSENIDVATEEYLEPHKGDLIQPPVLDPDPAVREIKGVPARFPTEQEELLARRDNPPTPMDSFASVAHGGFMLAPGGKSGDKLIQNPQTGDWHELVNGQLNPESIEQQEMKMAERQEARRIKATTGQMIRGIVDSTTKAIRGGYATTEVATARYQACLACEHFVRDASRCSLCGCFMRAKVKVALAACPANPPRWPQ